MKFDLIRPCGNCPFRTDCLSGWLGENRAEDIAHSLTGQDKTFPCHKTTSTDEKGDTIETRDSQHCAGAMIMLEKLENPNQLMRIAERLRMYDRFKLDMDADVFDNPEEFIEHHK